MIESFCQDMGRLFPPGQKTPGIELFAIKTYAEGYQNDELATAYKRFRQL